MKEIPKIAIYSGTIPSTTFIEILIGQLAKTHKVLLFGTLKQEVVYSSKQIKIINTPNNQLLNFLLTLKRTFQLFIIQPRLLAIAISEANGYKGIYKKWMRYCRFLPVLLHKPDIFHLQWANELDRWLFLKSAYGCKIVVSLLGTHINISPKANDHLKQMYLDNFKYVDAFHAVSKDLSNEMALYNVSANKVSVIHTQIKKATFKYFEVQETKCSNILKIVSVGRHHWVKGYRYAIEAIKLISNHGIAVEYTIIAPHKPTEELIYLIESLNLGEIIKFKSEIPQEELFKELKTYDLMLLSSVSEGIANVAVEAMAIGLPVLSTNCGGMSELIVDNYNGWLVPIRSADAISEAVIMFNQLSQKVKNEVVLNAHKFALDNFNEDRIGEEFLVLYKKVLNS